MAEPSNKIVKTRPSKEFSRPVMWKGIQYRNLSEVPEEVPLTDRQIRDLCVPDGTLRLRDYTVFKEEELREETASRQRHNTQALS